MIWVVSYQGIEIFDTNLKKMSCDLSYKMYMYNTCSF